MIPPKYKFYVGVAIDFNNLVADRYINPSTGQVGTAVNAVSSYPVYTNAKTVYVNYSPSKDIFDPINNVSAEGLNIHMYGDNSKYLGKIAIRKAGIYTFNEDTTNIAIEFIGMTDSIREMHKGLTKTGFSEIYAISQVTPHYKDLAKKYAKESGQEFFRISLEGRINLYGDGYELINGMRLDDDLAFFIQKQNATSGEWYEYYKGRFNKTDCKFDHEKKKCELKLTALDRYNKVMDGYENTYDLVKIAPEISKIDMHKRSLMQVYIRGANSISNFFGGTYWEDDVIEAIDSHDDLIKKYYFSYIKAGNEFYVEGANISEVNGVYAGTDGIWSQWNGHTCYIESGASLSNPGYIYIKRNGDNTILYRSVKKWAVTDPNNKYIGREDVEMVNVNDDTDKFTIKSPIVYHIYQRLLCDVDTVTDSEGTKNTYDLPVDDFVADNRNYKKCIGLLGGMFFCTSRTIDTPTKYGVNDYNKYFTNQFIPAVAGIGKPLPISRNVWANSSLWYVYDDILYETWEEKLRKKYTLKDSYSIAAVIKALLSKIDPTIRHEATAEYSQFLYGYMPLYADRFYVYITQKTNILKGQYDQAAQKAEITLEDVMKMLRDCFRCYWYIDDNKLKIEHISFFMNGGQYNSNAETQLDFTRLKDQFNKKLTAYFQSEVEFDKSELNSRYEFNWMDDVTELFGQVTIDVKANYVQKDKNEEVNVSQFSSDVDFMLFNPSNFSDDGFALLCPVKKGTTLELPILKSQLKDENGDTYSLIAQNWYASWAYLASRFYMHDMPAYNVDINVLNNIPVMGIKRCMKHTMEFPIAEDLDELKLIKTSLGEGKIDEFTVSLDTRLAKVKLLYEPK